MLVASSIPAVPIPAVPPAALARPDAPPANLLDRLAQGDEAALEALYTRYSQAIYALALRIVRQPALAEDVVQETFIRAWRAAGSQTEAVRDPGAWLLRIARNLALDALRRQAVRPQPVASEEAVTLFETAPDPAPDPEAALGQATRRQAVRRALASLPAEQREAVCLAFFEGLTHQAIAQQQGLPLGTVKTRVRLGLRKLALCLDGEV